MSVSKMHIARYRHVHGLPACALQESWRIENKTR